MFLHARWQTLPRVAVVKLGAALSSTGSPPTPHCAYASPVTIVSATPQHGNEFVVLLHRRLLEGRAAALDMCQCCTRASTEQARCRRYLFPFDEDCISLVCCSY